LDHNMDGLVADRAAVTWLPTNPPAPVTQIGSVPEMTSSSRRLRPGRAAGADLRGAELLMRAGAGPQCSRLDRAPFQRQDGGLRAAGRSRTIILEVIRRWRASI
jgi:hypothetical protein